MKLLAMLFFLLSLSHVLFSQTNRAADGSTFIPIQGGGNVMAVGFKERNLGVKGTPYLSDGWLHGTLTARGNAGEPKVYTGLKLKLDIENQLVYCIRAQSVDSMIVTEASILYLDVLTPSGQQRYVMLPNAELKPAGQLNSTYFLHRLLHEGKNKLVESVQKKFIEVKNTGAYAPETPSYYQLNTTLWLLKADGSILKVPLKKSGLAELFLDKLKQVENYVAENKLGMKKPEDWAKVLAFYEGL
jgi:hypothetical protein